MNTITLFNGDLELSVQQNSATNNHELVLKNVSNNSLTVDVVIENQNVNPTIQVLNSSFVVAVNSTTMITDLSSFGANDYTVSLTLNGRTTIQVTLSLLQLKLFIDENQPLIHINKLIADDKPPIIWGIVAAIEGLTHETEISGLDSKRIVQNFFKELTPNVILDVFEYTVISNTHIESFTLSNYEVGAYCVEYYVKIGNSLEFLQKSSFSIT